VLALPYERTGAICAVLRWSLADVMGGDRPRWAECAVRDGYAQRLNWRFLDDEHSHNILY